MTEGDGWPSDANACQKHEAGRLLQLRAEAIAKKTDAYLWIKTVHVCKYLIRMMENKFWKKNVRRRNTMQIEETPTNCTRK